MITIDLDRGTMTYADEIIGHLATPGRKDSKICPHGLPLFIFGMPVVCPKCPHTVTVLKDHRK